MAGSWDVGFAFQWAIWRLWPNLCLTSNSALAQLILEMVVQV